MSSTKVGKVAIFPPLTSQPYPPARNHARWKEIYRLHDEWIMKYWPFSSEKKRARIPFMNLAGFTTWSAPAADFDRVVLGARLLGTFILADDYIDSGKMLDRIPGFKKVATGTGPLHPEDRAERCHDIAFRAVKATSHPRTFDQLTKCTHEWWDSHMHESYRNLDHYLAIRRVNIGAYLTSAIVRYVLDINLTDEQVDHPLMREAEGIVGDHVGLTNDFFSYAKERMTNSDDTNVIRILQDNEGLTYEQAKDFVEKNIRQKEQEYIPAGLAVLNDPELGKDPEVRRWIACLPYCMGGNNAWSQESGRYNIGDTPGGVPFPSLSYETEATPVGEDVDEAAETQLRNQIFSVESIPPPDFTVDFAPIATGKFNISTQSTLSVPLYLSGRAMPHPDDVGILAMEVFVPSQCTSQVGFQAVDSITPAKVDQEHLSYLDGQDDINYIAFTTMSSLLMKYGIDPPSIGRLEVTTETSGGSSSVGLAITQLFGGSDIEIVDSKGSSAAALFSAVSWVESSMWDGRKVMIFAGDISTKGVGAIATLVGPNAPVVVEPTHGIFTENTATLNCLAASQPDVTALTQSYLSYKRRSQSVNTNASEGSSVTVPCNLTSSEFDYMVYEGPYDTTPLLHACVHFHDYLAEPNAGLYSGLPHSMQNTAHEASLTNREIKTAFMQISATDYATRVAPTSLLSRHCGTMGTASLYGGLASVIGSVPGYDLFEKRISVFAHTSKMTSSFFVLRIKGDTKPIYEALNLAARVTAMREIPAWQPLTRDVVASAWRPAWKGLWEHLSSVVLSRVLGLPRVDTTAFHNNR